eukprot:COSAG03_NODE_62_length_15480_cov_14.902412_3_plen_133_part_00
MGRRAQDWLLRGTEEGQDARQHVAMLAAGLIHSARHEYADRPPNSVADTAVMMSADLQRAFDILVPSGMAPACSRRRVLQNALHESRIDRRVSLGCGIPSLARESRKQKAESRKQKRERGRLTESRKSFMPY